MATPQQVPLKPDKTQLRWSGWFYILVPILLSLLGRAQQIRQGDIGGAVGQTFGVMFFPFVIAYIIRGRKGDLQGFSRWFFWLGILLAAGSSSVSH